jgi:hypothetical protein
MPAVTTDFVAATTATSKSAPWAITSSTNQLEIAEDGELPTIYNITVPDKASVTTTVMRDQSGAPITVFDIQAATRSVLLSAINAATFNIPVAPDNKFTVTVNGANYTGSLTSGPNVPIATLVTDIGALLCGAVTLSTVATVVRDAPNNLFKITHKTYGLTTISVPYVHLVGAAYVENPLRATLGFTNGYTVGVDGNNTLELSNRVSTSTVTFSSDASKSLSELCTEINTQVGGSYFADLTNSNQSLRITNIGSGAQTISLNAVEDSTTKFYSTVGLYEGQTDTVAELSAAEFAANVNSYGKIAASVTRTVYGSGDNDGAIIGSSAIRVPQNSLPTGRTYTTEVVSVLNGSNVGTYHISSVSRNAPPGYDTIFVSGIFST